MNARRLPFFDKPAGRKAGHRAADTGKDVTAEFALPGGPAAMSVSALIARIKDALADAFPQRVCVIGEISNL